MIQGHLPVSDDVSLRPLEEADAGALHSLIELNRARLARWLPWAASQTFEDTLDFIRRTRLQLRQNEGAQLAIVRGDEIVGMVGYPNVDWTNRSTHIGYWLDQALEGKGIATAAVRMLVDHALSVWRLNRVEIRVAAENDRSRAIPERLAFRQEGRLRQAERLVDGHYTDTVVYSTLAADWAVRSK